MPVRAEAAEQWVERRRLVPPELRDLELIAGRPDPTWLGRLAPHLFVPSLAIAAAVTTANPPIALVAPAYLAYAALTETRQRAGKPLVCLPLRLRPWGVLTEQGPLPWRVILGATHHQVVRGTGDRREPWSELELELADRRVRAELPLTTMLEGLEALVPRFRADNDRLIALGLEPDAARAAPTERVLEELLDAARQWLASPEGKAQTHESKRDYRGSEEQLHPELIPQLRRRLLEQPVAAEHAPFAAVVAAELGIEELREDLCALVLSPHPAVAAVAIGAAQKLGAHPSRVGRIHDLEPFLPSQSSQAIERWSH